MSNYGMVEYFGSNDGSYPCGYCKAMKADNTDYGMWAHSLSPTSYQNLIDRNWRRSGKYCYKPILHKTCCPMYTIRCDALNFKLRKSQKKVVKKFNRYLLTGEKPSKRRETDIQNLETCEPVMKVQPILGIHSLAQDFQINSESITDSVTQKSINCDNKVENMDLIRVGKCDDKPVVQKITKARVRRREKKVNKIMEKEKCDEFKAKQIMRNEAIAKIKVKSIEDLLTENQNNSQMAHKLEIKFVSTTTDEYKDTYEASHEVYKKYQMAIHGDSEDKCTPKQYKRFLIDSPLDFQYCKTNKDLPNNLGSVHQQYWLDNKLIAVGVIDILPNCLSSVYLYYDPDYDFLSLGTYSALREIHLVRQLQQFMPNLKYYYMGFYIHSCPKMRYKGNFIPSDLLCPEVFSWHSISQCLPKLEISKYSRFNDNKTAIDRDGEEIKDDEIMILYDRQVMTCDRYKSLQRKNSQKQYQQIKEYSKLVGKSCSKQILLYRS